MSTNSTISYANENKTISTIYCHWDGYTETVGKILSENYNCPILIKELIMLGNISSLSETSKDTIAYGRDKGYPDQEHREYPNYEEVLFGEEQEYNYLFAEGKWSVYCNDAYEQNVYNSKNSLYETCS